jgi:hypothetical protein
MIVVLLRGLYFPFLKTYIGPGELRPRFDKDDMRLPIISSTSGHTILSFTPPFQLAPSRYVNCPTREWFRGVPPCADHVLDRTQDTTRVHIYYAREMTLPPLGVQILRLHSSSSLSRP